MTNNETKTNKQYNNNGQINLIDWFYTSDTNLELQQN